MPETAAMSGDFSAASLPNRFDYRENQGRIYQFWENGGYFNADVDARRRPYTIVIPPPNVTGALHLGHALNNSLQDIMIRMKRMQGFNALWMPGTDHAGIATQAVVEKRLREEEGQTRHDLGREQLVERIWQWKGQYEARILHQLKQLGASCDWRRTRFTLDEQCARAVRRTFFDLFRQQKIYRGKRLVNWDTYLQTAVSDDEVFHEATKGHFWHFRYPVIDPQPGEPTHVTIATTRPETMLGDTAVAVHPDPAAALARLEAELEERLQKAPAKERPAIEAQRNNVRTRQEQMLPQLIRLRDMARQGQMLQLPLLQRPIPLVLDEWAKPELGSGCVKITPAHDPNDYEVGLRCRLPMINILNRDGTLNANAGPYQGLNIQEARKRVVQDLEAQRLVVEIEDREIDLAHSDRSKTPIEPYLADQWFVRMDQLAQSAMDAVMSQRVKIFPQRYEKGYLDWLSEKRDWPVSRQLWWGHQIPIWSLSCGDEATIARAVKQLQQDADVQAGRVAYQVEQPEKGQSDDIEQAVVHLSIAEEDSQLAQKYERQGYQREEDVLDTWFSSALWPHSTLGWPEKTPELDYFYPTSILITSRDIITLWVARMVLTGLHNVGDVPFREVFIHPKILDGFGETMSKSKGNGVDPIDVIDKFGADALRFGLAYMTTETQDVRMPVDFECPHCQALIEQTKSNRMLPRITCPKCGEPFATQWAEKPQDKELARGAVVSDRFEQARNFCNKLWNAARFALMKLEGYTPGTVEPQDLSVEDRWILSRLSTVTEEVTTALESYRFADAARSLYGFAWDEFCSNYVELSKARLQLENSRVVTQRVLAHTLDTLLRLLHPLIPFITEEIWQLLGRVAPQRGLMATGPAAESIIIARWPTVEKQWQDPEIERRFADFQNVVKALRDIRAQQNIPSRQQIHFLVRCDRQTAQRLQPMAPHFGTLAGAQPDGCGPEVQEPSGPHATTTLPGMNIFVDLRGLIDVSAEIARNEQSQKKLSDQIHNKERKLANESFIQRAPAEVVQRERDSLEELRAQLATLQAAREALQRDA